MIANITNLPTIVGTPTFSRARNNYVFYSYLLDNLSTETPLTEAERSVIETCILRCHSSHWLTAINSVTNIVNSSDYGKGLQEPMCEFVAGWYGNDRTTRLGMIADAINYSGVNDIVNSLYRMYGSRGLHSGAEYKQLFVEMNALQDRTRITNPPELYINLLTPVIAYIDADISSVCHIEENYALISNPDECTLQSMARALLNLRVFDGIDHYMLTEFKD